MFFLRHGPAGMVHLCVCLNRKVVGGRAEPDHDGEGSVRHALDQLA
jgi:hypothetical protein